MISTMLHLRNNQSLSEEIDYGVQPKIIGRKNAICLIDTKKNTVNLLFL